MVNAFGAMHAALRARKRQQDLINSRVKTRKAAATQRDDDDAQRPRQEATDRGDRT